MFIRKFFKILRGQNTFLQVLFASILGAVLGFTPGFVRAPGLTIFVIFLFLILNANLGIFLFVFAISKILFYLFIPLVFNIGVFLIDRAATSLFEYIVNTPVLALFGFEYYLTSGGFLIGIFLGILFGLIIFYLSKLFKMSETGLSESSPKFKKFKNSFVGKIIFWILFGSGKDIEETTTKRVLPIRITGVALVVVIIIGFFVFQQLFAGAMIKKFMVKGLERINGATVDVGSVDVSFNKGKLIINKLEICDPEKLDENVFSAKRIVADLSVNQLLLKRLRLDKVEVFDGELSSKRVKPGKIITPLKVSEKKVEKKTEKKTVVKDKGSLEDYISNAKDWKIKLAKIKNWYKKLKDLVARKKLKIEPKDKSYKEALKEKALAMGYQNVKASYLIKGAPVFAATLITANNIKASNYFKDETLAITIKEISTNPNLSTQAPEIVARSSKNTFYLNTVFNELSKTGGKNNIDISMNKVALNKALDVVKVKVPNQIKDGYVTLKGVGSFFSENDDVKLNLKLDVRLEDSLVAVPKLGDQKIKLLTFPVYLTGELDNPVVKVDTKTITDQLKGLWKNKLKSEVKRRLNEEKDKLKKKYQNKLENKVKRGLGDFLN
ncbi:conserved hypothetical protein [Deferribacter desulfuricans SSM1]|uniref:DUF2062 domain-containing protein n=1 Tax=Deferribacter desulfuricans (strain DSM 14783 / JCM 11476 / NBRC 101012 / SSM1) TaxID=639282 RepID=D3P8Q4_DEFDS|nr:hypothetical protein [Deferribacter desulfuricans]BAI81094.1 conserved hypothetical protein [Deferribacter desulfuricans SSM1]